MTANPIDPHDSDEAREALVLPFRPVSSVRARLEAEPGEVEARGKDTSFEVDLDEHEDRTVSSGPVLVDPPTPAVTRRPIIPESMRGKALVPSAQRVVARSAHVVGYHVVRSPWYGLLVAFWAVVGVFKLLGRGVVWWWQPDAVSLEQEAARANDPDAWIKVRKDTGNRRSFRFAVLLVALAALAFGAAVARVALPLWAQLALVLALVPLLARFGRPPGRTIINPAVVKPRFRKLNADIVLRAYYRAKLGNPDKEDERIEFASNMTAVGEIGSMVIIDLPYGSTTKDAIDRKPKIASGIDVTEWQVFITRDASSIRRHTLLVLYQNPLAIPAGMTPLLNCKPRDVWKPAPLGIDERSRAVLVEMIWNSFLIGAQPRKGKTFTARLLALYAALDPYVKLWLIDGKSSPDWRSFALVAEATVYGTVPLSYDEDDPVEKVKWVLKTIKRHIQRVNQILSSLPTSVCPEGKLTRELHRDPRYPELCVWVLIMEEFQAYYELEDKEDNTEIASLLNYIQSQGPSAGVILISATQKPSGVGSGEIAKAFTRFRDNHQVRIALKCANRVVSEAVLGGDAYGEGYDASALPVEAKGVGYVYGASDETPLARFHLANRLHAETILTAARKYREQAGTLTGEAAGDVLVEAEIVDPLADALRVMGEGEANISWPRLAARLAEEWPGRYEGFTGEALSARLRGMGVKGKSVADREFFPSGRGRGVARTELEQVAAQRRVLP